MYAFMGDDMKMEWAELLKGDLTGMNDGDGDVKLNTVPEFLEAYEMRPRFITGEDGGFLGVQLITPWDAILDTALEILTVQLKNEWVTLELPPYSKWKHDLKEHYFSVWIANNIKSERKRKAVKADF